MTPPWIALIPAYEPAADLLHPVVAELGQAGFVIVVVDDGSTDQTALADLPPDVVRLTHPVNRGKGAALRTGLTYIAQHWADATIVTIDADGQHPVYEARRCCQVAERRPGHLVLGVRRFGPGTPAHRLLANLLTVAVFYLAAGHKVTDTQTGLRAFSADLIPFLLALPGERYEYEMTMLLEAPRHGITLDEVAIPAIYIGDNESSHFDALRDSYLVYRQILGHVGRRLTGR